MIILLIFQVYKYIVLLMSVYAFKKRINDNQEERIHETLKFLHKTRFQKKIDLVLVMLVV